ncbi:MAG TPA: glycosyltransferase, partial [Paludibacteraceae bacterium]|nr:glycosyltransferase [Paludibacteraceae bacterium]
MKLSIITINYNNVSGLQKTLESVFRQTCRAFEYIVVDGASKDGSKELLEQFS